MAFSNIDNLTKFLQIAFSEGIRSQISQDYRDWDLIKQQRESDPEGREVRFLLQKSLGAAAVQYRNPNFSSTFPSAQQVSASEHTAVYKEVDVTIELPYNVWNRLQHSKNTRYADELAIEIQSKTIASKRRLAADLYGDGTGVVGTVASAADTTGAGGFVTITLSSANAARGHVGFFEYHDLLLNKNPAGTADDPTVVGTFYAWRVKSKSRKLNQVVLEAVDASGAVLSLTASSIDAADYLYRVGQPTFPDLTAAVPDYGTITEVMAGLESLAANDGRVIHGITMTGSTAGTVIDGQGNPLDISMLQELLDTVKVNVGRSLYRYRMMSMAPEAHAALVESRETDRRFNSVEDAKRGIRVFQFQHEDDSLESYTSEYIPFKRLYTLPDAKAGQKVLEYWGTDFEPVQMGRMGEFHLKPASGGGHERRITSYMEALCCLICKHPAAVGRLENFTA